MPRDYKAEFNAREQQAIDRGFRSYREERVFKETHREQLDIAGEEFNVPDYRRINPNQLNAYYERMIEHVEDYHQGANMHNAMAYGIQWLDMTEDEALEYAREIFGKSPGAD